MDWLIKCDKQWIALCVQYNEQEMYLKYLEGTIDNVKKVSFQVKNYIDIKKFFAGDY